MASITDLAEATKTRVLDLAGGAARLQVILVLAAVLGLDTAQLGTLSAVSELLKRAFHVSNTQIGLLLAIVSFIGAIATLPMGVLADRMRRQRVLIVAVLVWGAAMVLSGVATSYPFLLSTRAFLGAVTAAAWPCVASLTGDFFPARDRASVYGLILSGEMLGAGIGFFISGEVGSFMGWRWSFFVMAAPSFLLAWVLWRFLPEPQRGGQSWLKTDERDPSAASRPSPPQPATKSGRLRGSMSLLAKKMHEANVEPRPGKVLQRDPTRWSLWHTMIYLLSLPTYTLLIVASTLAYFFFSGAEAFAMIYFAPHYRLPASVVSALVIAVGIGALAGLLIGGNLSRRLLYKGKINARIIIPACALFLSVPFFAAGIWLSTPWVGVPLLVIGTTALTAAMAPIDAARLDIVHPRLWGRGEGGRMALRATFEGGAPLLFGAMSGWLGGGTQGLMWSFLIMLIPMLIAGGLIVPGLRTYPRDVATAAASVEATRPARRPAPPRRRTGSGLSAAPEERIDCRE